MKKIIALFCFIASVQTAIAQNPKADSSIIEIEKTKDIAKVITLMYDVMYFTNTLTQQENIDYCKKLLAVSKKQQNKLLEALVVQELAYNLFETGCEAQGTELAYTSLKIAEKQGNKQVLGTVYFTIGRCQNFNEKKLEYFYKSLVYCTAGKDTFNIACALLNLGDTYYRLEKTDSALYYAQRCYEYCLANKQELVLTYNFGLLANIHFYLLKDKDLAYEYARKEITSSAMSVSLNNYLVAYADIANFFLADGKIDSALHYADNAAKNQDKITLKNKLYLFDLYKKIYKKTNADSALKYYELSEITKDSLSKISNQQQQQILLIKNEITLNEQEVQRKQNIQYALLALGIITFIITFLLLSRRHITNTKLIQFLGVVALLLVFEFLNLLLHPFLEGITHHSPVLMLLALVGIAALLVPLHHKLEKWATHKLVEKNKAIRLASAKKTIEELEKESN